MKNRHEILFLYDVSWANPNGDPMDENRPRIDEETGINIVSDVRLKRTVRDTLQELGFEIFLREERKEDGSLKTKEDVFAKYGKNPAEVLKRCIDIRLFGGTFALREEEDNKNGKSKGKKGKKKESLAFSLTGPVQFKFGHSLHRVKVALMKNTSVMPSKTDKKQGTFAETYVVPYSLIVFYGVANEKAAETTGLTDEDVDNMLKAIWVGHKASTDLITRSKLGHEPRLLLDIIYKPETLTHMGELDKLVSFDSDRGDEAIRDIEDGVLNLEKLKVKVEKYRDRIQKVRYKIGDRVRLRPGIEEVFAGVDLEPFPWDSEV